MCPGFGPGDEYEQTISLVTNPRRSSKGGASYSAFPELYSKVGCLNYMLIINPLNITEQAKCRAKTPSPHNPNQNRPIWPPAQRGPARSSSA